MIPDLPKCQWSAVMLLTYVITQKNLSASLDREGDLEMNLLVVWFYRASVHIVEWPFSTSTGFLMDETK